MKNGRNHEKKKEEQCKEVQAGCLTMYSIMRIDFKIGSRNNKHKNNKRSNQSDSSSSTSTARSNKITTTMIRTEIAIALLVTVHSQVE